MSPRGGQDVTCHPVAVRTSHVTPWRSGRHMSPRGGQDVTCHPVAVRTSRVTPWRSGRHMSPRGGQDVTWPPWRSGRHMSPRGGQDVTCHPVAVRTYLHCDVEEVIEHHLCRLHRAPAVAFEGWGRVVGGRDGAMRGHEVTVDQLDIEQPCGHGGEECLADGRGGRLEAVRDLCGRQTWHCRSGHGTRTYLHRIYTGT